MRVRLRPEVGLVCLMLGGSGCSLSDAGGDGADVVRGDDPATGSGGASGVPVVAPGMELDLEDQFRAPINTGKYVWSANPATSRVALINAETFDVRTVEAGFEPTYLAPLPAAPDQTNRVLVLNVRSTDASLLAVDAAGDFKSSSVPVHERANAWAVRDDGEFAVAWSNSRLISGVTAAEGFQDVTLLRIDGDAVTATRLTVGYRPSAIRFSSDGTTAFAVTESGISVITLGDEPSVTGLVLLSPDPIPNPAAQDVTITPDGSYALVRTEGSAHLTFVELESGEFSGVDLAGPVTDLELSADGMVAVAVVRDPAPSAPPEPPDAGAPRATELDASLTNDTVRLGDGGVVDAAAPAAGGAGEPGSLPPEVPVAMTFSELTFLPIPDIFDDPSAAETHVAEGPRAGSVAVTPDGEYSVLYLTSTASSRVTVVSRQGELRSLDLRATVQAVFPSDDGEYALVLQVEPTNPAKPGAFSIVPLSGNRAPRIEATVAAPHSVALLPSSGERASDRALVTVSSGPSSGEPGSYAVYLADTDKLSVESFELSAEPLATGMVPEVGRGIVAQKHPEGLLSFFELDGGDRHEITGFELASKVVNE